MLLCFSDIENLKLRKKTPGVLWISRRQVRVLEILVHLENLREKVTKVFSMGYNKLTTMEIAKLKFQGKEHVFSILPNDFLLPEDNIIGIPFMHSHKFNLVNTHLELDRVKHKLHNDGMLQGIIGSSLQISPSEQNRS